MPGRDPAMALEGAPDQLVARLGEHLDGHVIGDQPFVDDVAAEVEIGLAGGGEADLDLLEAEAHEFLEHAQLAPEAHRLHERLVAVAQIDGTPDGRPGDDGARPGPVGQVDRLEGDVFVGRIDAGHGSEAVLGLRAGARSGGWRGYRNLEMSGVRRRYGYTRRAAVQARRAPVRPRSRMPPRSNMTPGL